VLVVEPDPALRAYLSAILERHGYRVVAGSTGEEALAGLGGEQALLAVLDVGLPGTRGFAIAEQLAAEVPVIIVTGDPERARLEAPRHRSDVTILAKPVASAAFGAAVHAAL
jgi:DNA-binding response OmpR family regulator